MTLVREEVLQPTATVLGPSHPLVETIETLAEARRQVLAVGVILLVTLPRSEPTAARGVALARALLTNGALSPLHRGEIGSLRRELRRIRFLLQLARP
jgi:hypothetical protein